jgi:molybdopterin-containing oxidoreductase family membrane subunit
MFEGITEYGPTIYELMISAMIYGTGLLVLTILWKVAIGVKKEIGAA